MTKLLWCLTVLLFSSLTLAEDKWVFRVPSTFAVNYGVDSDRNTQQSLRAVYATAGNSLWGVSLQRGELNYEESKPQESYAVRMNYGTSPLEDIVYTFDIGASRFEGEIVSKTVEASVAYEANQWALAISPAARHFAVEGITMSYSSSDIILGFALDYKPMNNFSLGINYSNAFFGIDPQMIYESNLINEISYGAESRLSSLYQWEAGVSLKFGPSFLPTSVWYSQSESKIGSIKANSYGLITEFHREKFFVSGEGGLNDISGERTTFGGIGLGFVF